MNAKNILDGVDDRCSNFFCFLYNRGKPIAKSILKSFNNVCADLFHRFGCRGKRVFDSRKNITKRDIRDIELQKLLDGIDQFLKSSNHFID